MAKTRKIDWLNHGLEFLVVIVGILLAFQLDSCKEDRRNQKLLDQHLTNLIEECQFNLKMVDLAIVQGESSQQNINQLIGLIIEQKQWDTINRLSMDQLDFKGVYFKTNAYESLIQSGDVRLIKDFDLKNDIINLYEYFRWAESYDNVNGEVFTGYFLPYVMSEFDLFQLQTSDPEVYTNRRFKNALGTMNYQYEGRLEKYKETKEQIEKFLANHKSP